MSQPPIPNAAAIIRGEFSIALNNTLKRAAVFDKGEEHANFIMDLAVKTSFFIAAEPVNLRELFEDRFLNNAAVLPLLDLLHEFMVNFHLGLSLHDTALPEHVMQLVVSSLTVNTPENNTSTVLPAHVLEAFADNAAVKHVMVGNSWFYALTLIRMFGAGMLFEDVGPVRQRGKPQ